MAEAASLDITLSELGTSTSRLMQLCPSSEHLCRIALAIGDWKAVGRLLGLSPDEINEVDEENASTHDKKIGVLDRWWQKNVTKATYVRLLEALYQLKRVDLMKVVVEYSNEEREALVVLQKAGQKGEQGMINHIKILEKQFRDIRTTFIKYLKRSSVSCADIIHSLTLLPVVLSEEREVAVFNLLPEIERAESIDSIFFRVARLISFIDYHLLEYLIEQHGNEETKKKMIEYTEEVAVFRYCTTVAELMKFWQGKVDIPDGFVEISVEFEKDPEKYSLAELNRFRRNFCCQLMLRETVAILMRIEAGSFIAVFGMPSLHLNPSVFALGEFYKVNCITSVWFNGSQVHASRITKDDVTQPQDFEIIESLDVEQQPGSQQAMVKALKAQEPKVEPGAKDKDILKPNQPRRAGDSTVSLSRALEETHRRPNVRARMKSEPMASSSHKPARARQLYKRFQKFIFGNAKGSTDLDLTEALPVCDFVTACKKLHSSLQYLSEELRDTLDIAESLKALETLRNKQEVCISVFGQRNCGKSTLTNALLGEKFLPIRFMSETSVRTQVCHDSSVHRGYCSGKRCTVKGGSCPTLVVKKRSKKDSKSYAGPKKIWKKIKKINIAVRKKKKESVSELTLTTWCPILAENVPQGWTVYLVDTPGIGEAKQHIEQLASEALEASAAYIYLLPPDGIEGREVRDILTSFTSKDASAVKEGRIIFAISKLDAIYLSEDDDDSDSSDDSTDSESESEDEVEQHRPVKLKRSTDAYTEIEAVTKRSLCSEVSVAIKHDLKVEQILALWGKWAFKSQLLSSISPTREMYPKKFQRRFKMACKCLSEHPNRQDISIPCPQDKLEEEAIAQLSPEVVVQHLNKVTGLNELRGRIKLMVDRCVGMWSSKVHREYDALAHKVKDFIKSSGQQQLQLIIDDVTQNLQDARESYDKLQSKHYEILQSIRLHERSQVWKDLESGFDKDILEAKVSEKGKELVADQVQAFKFSCEGKIEKRKSQPYGVQQFENDIEQLLQNTERGLESLFDSACSFRCVYSKLASHIATTVMAVGEIKTLAIKLCEELFIEDIEFKQHPTHDIDFTRSTRAPNLGDVKEQVEIPPVKLTFWAKFMKWLSAAFTRALPQEKELEESYCKWDSQLEQALEDAKKHMQEKCDSYFKEIKHETIKHFYHQYSEEVKFHLRHFEDHLKPKIEGKIKELEDDLVARRLERDEYDRVVKGLEHLRTVVSEAYNQYQAESISHETSL